MLNAARAREIVQSLKEQKFNSIKEQNLQVILDYIQKAAKDGKTAIQYGFKEDNEALKLFLSWFEKQLGFKTSCTAMFPTIVRIQW